MGAALVLDHPIWQYKLPPMTPIRALRLPRWSLDLDVRTIRRSEADFESKCGGKCLELAERATRCDSTNVEWLRVRAFLQWCDAALDVNDGLRAKDWIETMDDAARHDPGNALYDYLAADYYWRSTVEGHTPTSAWPSLVRNGEPFKQGMSRFEQGQQKPFLAVDELAASPVIDFLQRSGLPPSDQQDLLLRRTFDHRRTSLFETLCEWQDKRATDRAVTGDPMAVVAIHRQTLRLCDQYLAGDSSPRTQSRATA
jgi:hypothetical protein